MRGHITDTVFPDEGWTCGGSQIALETLTRVYENEEARELLVNKIPEMLQSQREGGLSSLRARQRVEEYNCVPDKHSPASMSHRHV